MPQVAVIQLGARMHYAVPALLARQGMLARFYTDVCGNAGMAGLLARVVPGRFRSGSLERLFGRQLPPDIDRSIVTTCEAAALLAGIRARFFGPEAGEAVEKSVLNRALRDGFAGADVLYTTCINSDLEVVRAAKRRGLRVIHEMMINPDAGRILRSERDIFPGAEVQEPADKVESGIARDVEKWGLCDLILVPSEFVRQSAVRLGADPDKIALVNYGVDRSWFEGVPERRKGRILSVGAVGLRKGHPYLASAVRILRSRGVSCEPVAVGPRPESLIRRPEFEGLSYPGVCPRGRMREEYLKSEIFVLPTLSEGSALAHLEAMACGLPVVTTPNCGSVVRDGVDGFIVPIRDPEVLADRIAQLLTDDALRARMSQNARARALEFTWDRYGGELARSVRRLCAAGGRSC